eukprot:764472-Hanusia_phi.AAC.7
MDGVTERTVAALRKLAKEGQITREQKRVLLTDVVEHHQAGECASEVEQERWEGVVVDSGVGEQVEIAYELLVARFCGPEEVRSCLSHPIFPSSDHVPCLLPTSRVRLLLLYADMSSRLVQ